MRDELNEQTATTAVTRQTGVQRERGPMLAVAVCGSLFFVLAFLAPPDGPPVATATAAQIRDFAIRHGAELLLGATTGLLAFMAFLVFTAALTRLVRSRLPDSILADVILGSGVLVVILQLLNLVANSMAPLLPGLIGTDLASVDDLTLRGWYGLTGFTHLLGDFVMAPVALGMAAFSVAARRGGLLPRWLCWLGFALAVAGALGTVGIATAWELLYPAWFTGLFGWWLWTLLIAVTYGLRWRQASRHHPD